MSASQEDASSTQDTVRRDGVLEIEEKNEGRCDLSEYSMIHKITENT